jgi:hypothetical protein
VMKESLENLNKVSCILALSHFILSYNLWMN